MTNRQSVHLVDMRLVNGAAFVLQLAVEQVRVLVIELIKMKKMSHEFKAFMAEQAKVAKKQLGNVGDTCTS